MVWFDGISTIVCYLMPGLLYTYILRIYVCFGWVLWHINPCRLFNAKSSLYICIKDIWFGLVWFYGISTIVSYFMPDLLYTYILRIYVCFGWVLWYINAFSLFNAKSFLYIYILSIYLWFGFYGISIYQCLMPNPFYTLIRYMVCKHICW